MKRKICQYLSEIVEETSVAEFWNMMENPPEGERVDCEVLAEQMSYNLVKISGRYE